MELRESTTLKSTPKTNRTADKDVKIVRHTWTEDQYRTLYMLYSYYELPQRGSDHTSPSKGDSETNDPATRIMMHMHPEIKSSKIKRGRPSKVEHFRDTFRARWTASKWGDTGNKTWPIVDRPNYINQAPYDAEDIEKCDGVKMRTESAARTLGIQLTGTGRVPYGHAETSQKSLHDEIWEEFRDTWTKDGKLRKTQRSVAKAPAEEADGVESQGAQDMAIARVQSSEIVEDSSDEDEDESDEDVLASRIKSAEIVEDSSDEDEGVREEVRDEKA
ncbi:hypothetical protein HII31_06441 [Pseudocercospora fuligena]|uniref:Uncharacterized protein n=1 Tax=Pseudocercospora fuligena TaxID=685502 RepID=A0A8H6RJZ0_9PEZI|nr:hypothetical protein HII31_06441 [Pseudocercospora fuligena]